MINPFIALKLKQELEALEKGEPSQISVRDLGVIEGYRKFEVGLGEKLFLDLVKAKAIPERFLNGPQAG
jgi:hypothetical protein